MLDFIQKFNNQFYSSVTIWDYVLLIAFILLGISMIVAGEGSQIATKGLLVNILLIILMWLRPFNMVYKILITLLNIILPIALYIDSVIAEKKYVKRKNEAIEKFNNGDSSEIFRMNISPRQLSIPEGYILVRKRNSELSKLDKIPEHEWFEYTIYNGLEESDIKPYLSFRSGEAKRVKRYYLIKKEDLGELKKFIENKGFLYSGENMKVKLIGGYGMGDSNLRAVLMKLKEKNKLDFSIIEKELDFQSGDITNFVKANKKDVSDKFSPYNLCEYLNIPIESIHGGYFELFGEGEKYKRYMKLIFESEFKEIVPGMSGKFIEID